MSDFFRAFWPAYQGHAVHCTVGLAVGAVLAVTPLPHGWAVVAVALLGLHEVYDGDLIGYPLNGLADVLAFLPGGWFVLGLRWEVLAVLAGYVVVQTFEGRRLSR